MSQVSTWRLFAFMDDDPDGASDELRLLADWQVEDAVRWCRFRGYDHIYLTRTSASARFAKKPPAEDVRHVFGGDPDAVQPGNTEGSVA